MPRTYSSVALGRDLSELLGVKVDLVMKRALKPRIGERIPEEVVLYGLYYEERPSQVCYGLSREATMRLDEPECVVLTHDVPEHSLRAGDLGTVVQVYPEGGVEVEFVMCSGDTQAFLTLSGQDVRKIDAHDLLATRRLAEATTE